MLVGLLGGHVLAGQVPVVALAAASSLLFESSESHMRSCWHCWATSYQVGPNAAGSVGLFVTLWRLLYEHIALNGIKFKQYAINCSKHWQK